MSSVGKWGRTARFSKGGIEISMIAEVGSPIDREISQSSVIRGVELLDVRRADMIAAQELAEEVRQKYVGKPYASWPQQIEEL